MSKRCVEEGCQYPDSGACCKTLIGAESFHPDLTAEQSHDPRTDTSYTRQIATLKAERDAALAALRELMTAHEERADDGERRWSDARQAARAALAASEDQSGEVDKTSSLETGKGDTLSTSPDPTSPR